MKKLSFFFLVLLILTSAIASFYPVFATEIFSDGFENDFTPWTGTSGTPTIFILNREYWLAGYDSEAEIDVYGVIGNELFFGQNYLTSNTGWILKADLTTQQKTVLYTGNKLAMWQGVIDGSVCWAAGEDRDGSNIFRSAIARATTSGASVTRHPNTGDCNEFIGVLDDGTQLVAGERKTGGLTEGSSYPNGAGLWTIPKSTWSDTGTWSRVYEDTDLYEWLHIAKFGSTYYALLYKGQNSKWKVMNSTNLTSWTVDLDYRGQTLTYDHVGQLIHLGNKLALICPVQSDSKWHLFILSAEGGSWTDYALDITLASENSWASGYFDSSITRIIFPVSRADFHTIYSIRTNGTDLRTEYTNLQGESGAFTPRMYEYCYKDGAVYYPICKYPTSSTSYIGKITLVAHHGSKAMMCDLDVLEYAYKTLASAQPNLFVRFYVKVTALPALNKFAEFLRILNSGGTPILYAGYMNDAGTYKWFLNVDGSGDVTYSETINVDQWYCLEVEFDANSDVHYLWRDGTQIIEVSRSTTQNAQTIRLGSNEVTGGWGADGYFDCVVVADTYIGVEAQNYIANLSQAVTTTWQLLPKWTANTLESIGIATTYTTLVLSNFATIHAQSFSTTWNVLSQWNTTAIFTQTLGISTSTLIESTFNILTTLGLAFSSLILISSSFTTNFSQAISSTWNVLIGMFYTTNLSQSLITAWQTLIQWNGLVGLSQTLTTTWTILIQSTFATTLSQTLASTWQLLAQTTFNLFIALNVTTSWIIDVVLTHGGINYIADLSQSISTTWQILINWNAVTILSKTLTSSWTVLMQWTANLNITQSVSTTWQILTQTNWNIITSLAPTTTWIVEITKGIVQTVELTITIIFQWTVTTTQTTPPINWKVIALFFFVVCIVMFAIGAQRKRSGKETKPTTF